MLKVTEIAFSCYAVTDMARARKFYEGVLGLKPTVVHNLEHGQWVEYEFGPYALLPGSSPAFMKGLVLALRAVAVGSKPSLKEIPLAVMIRPWNT
jgi:catechol 2,3-dioxygenase-like lactoylglutathione lyase family enzyme